MSETGAQAIVCGGLRYQWREGGFLSRNAAEYALRQLWRLCAGSAEWEGPPAVDIAAVDREQVDAMHRLGPGQLPWVPLSDVLPAGAELPLDTDHLPALCASPVEIHFGGEGAFPLDLVAAMFLMLTRWEESHHPGPADHFGRPLAENSLAARQGFLDRPVLDEWALVVRAWLCAVAPGWAAEPHSFGVVMTHDVDHPQRYPSLWRVVRGGIGELLLRSHCPLEAVRELRRGLAGWRDSNADPYVQAIRAQMARDESLGLRGAFHFMTASPSWRDEGYDLGASPCRELVAEIRERGHEIGWHPGFHTADDPERFAAEKKRMDDFLGSTDYGGRQHYLRWSPETSWDLWDRHGLAYDSSIGYANAVGFRCGTCHPFECFSLADDRALPLEERPLIIMDCAVPADEPELPGRLLRRAKAVSGRPVVLLHNAHCEPGLQEIVVDAIRDVT